MLMVLDSRDLGQGIAYLVMELTDGPTLYFEMLRRRRCPSADAAVVLPVCDVLIAAHATSIIHRDVKPRCCGGGKGAIGTTFLPAADRLRTP